jgi:uncharacterized protein
MTKMNEKIPEKVGETLLKLARASIETKLCTENQNFDDIKAKISTKSIFKEDRGVFVSLHKHGNLRGCIGNIEPIKTLGDSVEENAQSAAFQDTRFSPLTYEELLDTQIEISVLTKPEKLDFKDGHDLISNLRPNIDGVFIKKGYHRATFLPQVWNQLSDPELFLSHLCSKAGMSANEWEKGSVEVYTYQVQLFEEHYFPITRFL